MLYDPPSPLDFTKIGPQNFPPPPLQNFQNFCTPPGNIAVNKEVVLFTKMPNFVSFMTSVEFYSRKANSFCTQVTKKLFKKFLGTRKCKFMVAWEI